METLEFQTLTVATPGNASYSLSEQIKVPGLYSTNLKVSGLLRYARNDEQIVLT